MWRAYVRNQHLPERVVIQQKDVRAVTWSFSCTEPSYRVSLNVLMSCVFFRVCRHLETQNAGSLKVVSDACIQVKARSSIVLPRSFSEKRISAPGSGFSLLTSRIPRMAALHLASRRIARARQSLHFEASARRPAYSALLPQPARRYPCSDPCHWDSAAGWLRGLNTPKVVEPAAAIPPRLPGAAAACDFHADLPPDHSRTRCARTPLSRILRAPRLRPFLDAIHQRA